ncbi:MAG: hypothetical protein V7K40_24060 [Nostoc sp.]
MATKPLNIAVASPVKDATRTTISTRAMHCLILGVELLHFDDIYFSKKLRRKACALYEQSII